MDTAAHPIVILKLGGSLLDLPDLSERMVDLLARHPGVRPLFIAGGGAAADVVREWDRTFSLGESAGHALALQAMHLTASLLERILPRSRVIATVSDAMTSWAGGEWPILDVAAWLNASESHRDGLPESWAVTSDSLSAWVATQWRADALWLLKSVDLPAGLSVSAASDQGLVDPFFPQIASGVVRISWCNLRWETPALQDWSFHPCGE